MYNKARVAEAFGKYPDIEKMFLELTDGQEFHIVKSIARDQVQVLAGQHPLVHSFLRLIDRKEFKIGDSVFGDAKIIWITRESVGDTVVTVGVEFPYRDVSTVSAGELY